MMKTFAALLAVGLLIGCEPQPRHVRDLPDGIYWVINGQLCDSGQNPIDGGHTIDLPDGEYDKHGGRMYYVIRNANIKIEPVISERDRAGQLGL
jgi:hypothetical protein